jgi:iron(III) transport system ATP-binding protein
VALARAMVARPAVLLFDEPLSNLDAKLRLSMRREIRDAHDKSGGTSIYVTHDQEEAMPSPVRDSQPRLLTGIRERPSAAGRCGTPPHNYKV